MSSPGKQNEAALACAARKGDRGAMQQLLVNNWPWLKGLVYNVLGGHQDLDDALQNICVLVIDKITTLREPERFRAWLATVARNRTLAYRRQQSNLPAQLDELLAEQQQADQEDVVKKVAQGEQCEQILETIKLLPEKYREVFVLRYTKDMSYGEIGEILEIPITTVQIRLVRARRMIFNRLMGLPTNKVPRT